MYAEKRVFRDDRATPARVPQRAINNDERTYEMCCCAFNLFPRWTLSHLAADRAGGSWKGEEKKKTYKRINNKKKKNNEKPRPPVTGSRRRRRRRRPPLPGSAMSDGDADPFVRYQFITRVVGTFYL